MNPRLVVMAGLLKGTIFQLTEQEVSVGRESSNPLCLDSRSVSRRHCLIGNENGQFLVRDLGSRNGTFVNDMPIKERSLRHGDQIQIGDSVLTFLLDEDGLASTPSIQLEEGNLFTVSLAQLRSEDSVYLRPDKMLETLLPSSRMARDLAALLKISTAINSIQELNALQERLLELIFEVVPAEQGALLLVGDGPEEFSSASGWDRARGPNQLVQPSRTIVQQVLREGNAILSNNVLQDETFQGLESVQASQIRSVLCLPLQLFERRLGVIYLATRAPLARFDEDNLQLVTAIAAIASAALENARQMEWLKMENQRLQAVLNLKEKMVGESAPMRQVTQLIARVAPAPSTVLILRESGVGKELVARAIHQNGPRASKPFMMAVNCAAIPESLQESTLFGYEKDAFTGASKRTEGILKEADGGTVFLDEVAEMSPQLQAKLLRVLQENEFKRVGGKESITLDVRWVAATNKDLKQAVQDRTFREDLYYRLNVVPLRIPPLRERREDISLLATYFAAKYGKQCGRPLVGITPKAREILSRYDWPGNVRELENAIERAVVLGSGNLILPEDLHETLLEKEPSSGGFDIPNFDKAKRECRKQIILHYLEKARGKQAKAARLLGILPHNLRRIIRDEEISVTEKSGCPLTTL
jgi:transcriptional regulator with GAF, ATPase, and Fis domain